MLIAGRHTMGETDLSRRLGWGKAKKAQVRRGRALAHRRTLRKQRQAGSSRYESRESRERTGAPVDFLQAPHRAGAKDLVAETVTFRECQERPEIGLCEVFRLGGITECPEGGQPFRPPREQETVLEENLFGELQHAQWQRQNCGVEPAGEESRYQIPARSFYDVELHAGSRILEALQEFPEKIRRQSGHDSDGDSERTGIESLAYRFQSQCFVEDSEGLLMGLSSQGGQKDAATLALEQGRSENRLELSNLERECRL